ncbi:hypothetical protein [Hyalangium versicolor]|uniref:hypothetical protein n=1 Tax=Hyalangium versicolor TaxID=2861190 RepID=UPI001CCDA71A|nr:hypothetical protein [Hyalangium versicolor]
MIIEKFSVCFEAMALVRPGRLKEAWPLLRETRLDMETELQLRLRLHTAIQKGEQVLVLHRVSWTRVEAFRAQLPSWGEQFSVYESSRGIGSRGYCEKHALHYEEEPCPVCDDLVWRVGA